MCPVVIKFCFSKIITCSSIHDIPTAVNTYHEQFHFSVLFKREGDSLCGTWDFFIIAVIGHRFEPKSLTSKTQSGSKENFLTPANSLLAPSPITAIIESHVPSRASLHSFKKHLILFLARTKHTQTRFRSPETKFLNTFSKKQKISNSEYKAPPNLFIHAGLKKQLFQKGPQYYQAIRCTRKLVSVPPRQNY